MSQANGLAFAYLEQGPADGPLALCLHGFPDSAQTWRFLLPELGRAGFHAVAPWMRGYAPTEFPAMAGSAPERTIGDVGALHEALGGDDRAVLIGHDWGAVFSYAAAAADPDRWKRVVTMAVPPAGATAQGFMSYDQIKRSFYMFFFQSPAGRLRGRAERSRLHRPPLGGLVARLRRHRGPGRGAGRARQAREPPGRDRLLPGDVRHDAGRARRRCRAGRSRPGAVPADALPARPQRRMPRRRGGGTGPAAADRSGFDGWRSSTTPATSSISRIRQR